MSFAQKPLMFALLVSASACASEESPRLRIPVVVDGSGMKPVTSDLGYTVTLTEARAALRDLEFTVGGETHSAGADRGADRGLLARIGRLLLGTAQAHPGHQAGGDVTGELPGAIIVDWRKDGWPLGTAELVSGRYRGANFTFRRATASELPAGDPLIGHTFALSGTASKNGRTVDFTAVLDMDENTRLVGAPFDHEIRAGAAVPTLGLRLLPSDPNAAAHTVLNQIDFFALADARSQVSIAPGQGAHNAFFKALQVHDFYDVTLR